MMGKVGIGDHKAECLNSVNLIFIPRNFILNKDEEIKFISFYQPKTSEAQALNRAENMKSSQEV